MSGDRAPKGVAEETFLEGGGELGALVRAFDWTSTPLGPPATWPQSLKTAVRILLTSRQPFWLGWGPELTYLYNDPYKSIIGGKHPQALGRPFREVWSEIWDVVGPMADTVMTQNEGTYVEAQLLIMERHGYQEETYYTFSYSPIPNDDGGPGGLICGNTDDTRRVIGERQLATLREVATRTARARSWRDACVGSVDAATWNGRDLPFMLAYVFDENTGEPTIAACSEGTDRLVEPMRWGLGAGAELPAIRLMEVGTLGGEVPCGARGRPPTHAAVVPIATSGQVGRRVVLVLGLSPFRQFDEGYRGFVELLAKQIAAAITHADAPAHRRRRAESLAAIDRAKTEFFSNVSHEFRTPLTLMLGPLDDALADAERLPEDTQHSLEVARRNGVRLLKLVNTLLDFSRIEAGRVEASYEPTDLGAFTTELVSLFQSALDRAGLELVIDAPTLDEPTYVDREMWEKIVLNLVSNAFKFTFEGRIEVRLRQTPDGARLTVKDTGTGIPEGELPHLFERFHRVRGARGRTFEGSGIGLSLVQQLVGLHGGTVEVASKLNEGSTFSVTIPRGRAHLPATRVGAERSQASTRLHGGAYVQELMGWLSDDERPVSQPDPGEVADLAPDVEGRPRIVLADDNADMRSYLSRLLAPHYEIEAVSDGRQALEAVRKEPPELVISDVMMPELDGFGLVRELRADARSRATPVLLLSARAGEEARVEGIGSGADDYLAKPFSARELLARVSARIELSLLQKRLREERLALRELFAQTPMPIALLRGPSLVFEMANPAYLAVMSGRDILDKPLADALPEVAEQGFDELLRGVMRTGVPHLGSDVPLMLDRQGTGTFEQTYWTFIYAPLRNVAGEIDSVIAICNEVTEQVVARKAISDSEARYRHIFQTAGVAIREQDFTAAKAAVDELIEAGVTDIRRHCERHPSFVSETLATVQIVDVNDATVRMFGASDATDLVGPLSRWATSDSEALFVDTLVALAKGTRLLESEIRLESLSGEPIDVLCTIAFPAATSQLSSVLVTFVDITDRKRAQDALVESDRRKDEFIAMLSHELRNPLAALRSATQLVELTSTDQPKLRRATDVLDRQSAHMTKLIDGLLEVSRVARGKIQLEREALDLREVVAAVVADRRGPIERKGCTVSLALPAEPMWVEGDQIRLTQVFDNVIGNAHKFTESGGRIDVTMSDGADGVTVDVEDTGIGIRPEACSVIFEAFQQEPQDVARTAGGLGLGLALAKGLVDLHSGTISAFSEGIGHGARVRVTLPTTSPLAPEEVTDRESLPRSLRIVVVEDNDDAAEMLRELLELSGHEVRTAPDAMAGLRMIRERAPDVVLCDLGLPGLDGYGFARTVREDRTMSPLPLVALTGYGQPEDRKRAVAAGFDAHLLKPVDMGELNETLATLTANGRATHG